MKSDTAFRRNLLLVAALHVVFIGGVFWLTRGNEKRADGQVTWMPDGSVGGGEPGSDGAQTSIEPEPPKPAEPKSSADEPPAPENKIELISPPAPSEIVMPKATPLPVTPPPATPKPVTPKPDTPKPATPKPETPKPTTPKAAPKAPPQTSSKPKSTPKEPAGEKTSPKPKASPSDKPKSSPGAAKTPATTAGAGDKPGGAKPGGNGEGTGNGKGTAKTGSGAGVSQFGWYFEMLHDRFHTRWEQPTSIVRTGADFVTTLKIRIAKDGTISNREIVNSSGNPLMDESVMAAAQKVQQIDPLPSGLATGEFFEINVAFKLDQGR